MDNKIIPILQDVLKQNKRFDLAHKFENSYCEIQRINLLGSSFYYEVILYVDTKHYLALSNMSEEDKKLLLQILSATQESSIGSLDVKINPNSNLEKYNDIVYIFVDESGDMDFTLQGSKYYMFSFLLKRRPFKLHEIISAYRYTLLERNLDPLNGKRLNIEAFHACEDNKYIKEHIFNLLNSSFKKEDIKVYSYILEKQKVMPDKAKQKANFYADNLTYAITKFLEKINIDKDFIIITDRLAVQKNKEKQVGAIKSGIKKYLENKKSLRYDIFHHCSASSVNLQIIDYINWAIQRKYEHNDESFYNKIAKYILEEEIVTKDRQEQHY